MSLWFERLGSFSRIYQHEILSLLSIIMLDNVKYPQVGIVILVQY